MAVLTKRRIRSRRTVVCVLVCLCVLYCVYLQYNPVISEVPDLDNTRRYIENMLEEALKRDKGMGCEIPQLDPFSKEVTQFDKKLPLIKCEGQDWVKCYHSKCRVVAAIRDTIKDISCTFKDILYQSDQKYTIGPPTRLAGDEVYELKESDFVKVACVGRRKDNGRKERWSGNTLGLRPVPPPPAPRDTSPLNVLVFAFDSASRNGFIRRMPKSWQMLKVIGATVMEGYNIVGDGTPAALFPILLGKTELELPDVRKDMHNDRTLDSFPIIFSKLKQAGYRTAYFEDTPYTGTFQWRFNGFLHQPADHYLRAFFTEDMVTRNSFSYWLKGKMAYFCVGDTPQFKLMMNITEQFLNLDGKRFAFTFIADVSHDDFNHIQSADDDTAAFLHGLLSRAEDTLIVVMGDHGVRFGPIRQTLQGKLEERLPLLAVRLPERLKRSRPRAQPALQANARALTTPHDLHATILDALDLRQHWNPYTVRGSDYTRGMTMLEPISHNRSCSDAGIEPHWCTCLNWHNVSTHDPLYGKTARALIDYINSLVDTVGVLCMPRTLVSTEWVLRQRPKSQLLAFKQGKVRGGHIGDFNANTRPTSENYQIKIVAGPGNSSFEAMMTYAVDKDQFIISTRDISRTNAYGHDPDCISKTHPHLNPYCYCRQQASHGTGDINNQIFQSLDMP